MSPKSEPKCLEDTLGLAVRVVRDYGVSVIHIQDIYGNMPEQILDFTKIPREEVARAMQVKLETDEVLKAHLWCTVKSVQYDTNKQERNREEMFISISSIFTDCTFDVHKHLDDEESHGHLIVSTRYSKHPEPMRFEGKTFKEILKEKFGVDPSKSETSENKSNSDEVN